MFLGLLRFWTAIDALAFGDLVLVVWLSAARNLIVIDIAVIVIVVMILAQFMLIDQLKTV